MNIDHSKARMYTTPVRPARKCNTILETEIEGKIYRCERTRYKWSKFDQSFLKPMWEHEGELLFGKKLPIFFDQEGLMWFPEELTSEYLLKYYTQHPHAFLEIMFDRIARVKKVIALLHEIHSDIESDVPAIVLKNLETLREAFTLFYSTMGSVFMVYDAIPYRFKEVALKFLDKKTANVYLCEFMRAEITKEALKLGHIQEMPATSRSSTYGTAEPIVFYREPKLIYESAMDNEIMEKLRTSGLNEQERREFIALRLLLPAAVQINEEAQYIENRMLTAHMAVAMKNVAKIFGKSTQELEMMTYDEVTNALKGKMKKIAQGIGVSRGTAQGKVKIIRSMKDHAAFEQGDILVTRITNPTMVLVMGKAAGIICDIGSRVSHPSILSREMGIPCIVSAKCVTTGKPVTEILRDGQVVAMDGMSGEVYDVK